MIHATLSDQVKGSGADLRGFVQGFFRSSTLLRSLINFAVVGVGFILLINLLRIPKAGKLLDLGKFGK